MKKILATLLITPLLYACNSNNKSTVNSLLVNESQIAVDSIINRGVKLYNNSSNSIERHKIAQDLTIAIDSVYASNQYLFKNIYGVIDDINIYEHEIEGVMRANIVAYIADRTNRSFEVRYKISEWVKSDSLEDSRIYKCLHNAPQYSKVYITGLFDINDNGMLNIEHSYMRTFIVVCKHINTIELINDNL